MTGSVLSSNSDSDGTVMAAIFAVKAQHPQVAQTCSGFSPWPQSGALVALPVRTKLAKLSATNHSSR